MVQLLHVFFFFHFFIITATGKAFTVPLFTKYAHRLFPRRVCSIFEESSKEELEELNEALNKEPRNSFWCSSLFTYYLCGDRM